MSNTNINPNCILLTYRNDRIGSNFIFNLGIFLFAKINNLKIYGDIKHKYRNSIFFVNFFENIKFRSQKKYDNDKKAIFVKFCDPDIFTSNNGFNNQIYTILSGMRGPVLNSLYFHKQDLVSYYIENYKSKFLKKIVNKLSKYNLPWTNNKNVICIHIRADDMYKRCIQTHNPCYNHLISLINNDKWNQYYVDKQKRDSPAPIHYKLLEELIIKLKNKYPNKDIYIIKKGNLHINRRKIYQEIYDKYNLKIIESGRFEEDLWKMMNSDILVLSQSTFPYMSGFYHLGTQIYYEKWSVPACLGLGSKYDKSNWIGFPDKETLDKIGVIREHYK